VKRLIETSTGQAVLDLHRWRGIRLGLGVTVTRFSPDGWASEDKAWYEHAQNEPQTLAQFLAAELRVPGPEATALAQEISGPWVERWEAQGGDQEARTIGRFTIAVLTSLIIWWPSRALPSRCSSGCW